MKHPKKRLDDVADILMGQAPPGDSYNLEGDGWPLLAGPGDFKGDHPVAKKFTTDASKIGMTGDIVIGVRASIGDKVVADREYCLGRGVAALRAKSELHDRYLWHWLSSIKPSLEAKGKGATFKQVTKADIAELEIPLPPLEEQRRIAAILDRIASLLRLSERACTLNETLQESFFVDSFGEFRQAAARYPVLRLEDICSQITDGEHQTPLRSETGVKLLSARNIRNGRLDFSNVDHVPTDEFARIGRRCAPVRGDVLISCSGSIGRVAVVDTDEPLAMVRSAAMARPIQDKVRPLYLEFLLRSKHLQQCMQRSANASSQANLFQGKIRALPVFVPSLEEQDSFVARVSNVRANSSVLAGRSIEIQALMQSAQNAEFFDVLQR